MEPDGFGDSRTTPWCKEGARNMSSQRTFFTMTQELCGYAPACTEIQDYSRRLWVCPSIFQRSWGVSPVQDSPLGSVSSLSPDGEGAGFRGEVRAPHSREHRV